MSPNDYILASVLLFAASALILYDIYKPKPKPLPPREYCKFSDGKNICTLQKGHEGVHATSTSMYRE